MAGILDYKNFLNTLQTLSNIEDVFPSTQKTLTYNFADESTVDWTASIKYSTILVDTIEWNNKTPDFTNSQVMGYFPEYDGTITEYSNGIINIPAMLYPGPLLPTNDRHVPITIINITWTNGDNSFTSNLGLVQNWEPGVRIGDPYKWLYFEPIDPIASTLDLNGTELVIYKDQVTFIADSTIPISLGEGNSCWFFGNTGTGENILIGEVLFVDHRATLTTSTENLLTTGTWTITAEFRGVEQYGYTVSNELNLRVVPGIPLLTDYQTFDPDLARYFPGQNVDFAIQVYPDPEFTATGVLVENTTTITLINSFDPFTEDQIFYGNFVDGYAEANFDVIASMVDINLTDENSNWEITSYSTNTTVYTATIIASNDLTVETAWGYQTIGRYAAGSTNTSIVVANTTTVTLPITTFNMFLYSEQDSVVWGEPYTVNLVTLDSTYSQNITITAVKGAEEVIVYQDNNSGENLITQTISSLGTGTWQLNASYPGDFGDSIYWANSGFESNTIEVVIRAGNDLGAEFYFWQTEDADVVNVWASTSSTLTNVVSFLDNGSVIATGTWTRAVLTASYETVWYQGETVIPAMPSIHYRGDYGPNEFTFGWPTTLRYGDFSKLPLSYNSWGENIAAFAPPNYLTTITNDVRINYLTSFQGDARTGSWVDIIKITPTWEPLDYYIKHFIWVTGIGSGYLIEAGEKNSNLTIQDFGQVNPNPWRLWKYYDGTNYDLNDPASLLDPINTGTWVVEDKGDVIRDAETYRIYRPYGSQTGIYSTPMDYRWRLYDIYRIDQIGDYRGYNVIGIDADSIENEFTLPLDVNFKPSSRRVYSTTYDAYGNITISHTGTSLPVYDGVNQIELPASWSPHVNLDIESLYPVQEKVREITLVEYIGEIEWPMPIQTDAQADGSESVVNKRIKLYRFTPEVRQTNVEYKTRKPVMEHLNLLPANTVGPDGFYDVIPVTTFGVYRDLDGVFRQTSYVDSYRDQSVERLYGKKTWNSRNIYDANENEYTHFCNSWYTSFTRYSADLRGGNYIPDGYPYQTMSEPYATIETQTITTMTETTFSNTQTVQLELPLGTVSSIDNLRAQWEGTLGLPEENGRFAGFNLTAIQNPADINVEFYNISSPGVVYGERNTTGTLFYTATNSIFATNPVQITATASTDPYKYPLSVDTGTFKFYNMNSYTVLDTISTTTGQASIIVDASTLTNVSSSVNVGIRAEYVNELDATSISNLKVAQVVKNNFPMINFDYNSANLPSGVRTVAGNKVASKYYLKIAEISKSSTGFSSGSIYLKGPITVLLPFNNKQPGYSLSYATWYSSGQTREQWEPVFGQTSPIRVQVLFSTDGGSTIYSTGDELVSIRSSYETSPAVLTMNLNRLINGVNFSDTWTNFSVYINVLGFTESQNSDYWNAFAGLGPYSFPVGAWSSSFPPNCKFGYTQTLTLDNTN